MSAPQGRLGGFATMWGRRLLSFSVLATFTVVYVGCLPLLLIAAACADRLRRLPWPTVRCVVFLGFYLACEIAGVLASFIVWVSSGIGPSRRARALHLNLALQRCWTTALYRGAEWVFAMRTVVEGQPIDGTGPVIVFVRHVSAADTVLPVAFFSAPHGLALRFVLKRELLWDPCLDIVGHRLPNCFVRRGSGQSATEIAAVRALTTDLGPNDGVLIYPEGTRFTAEKRVRILASLAARNDPLLAEARALTHVLPPQLGGPLGLLEGDHGADVVIIAHTGLEGSGSFRDLLDGTLIGATVRLRFWRVPFVEIPTTHDARVRWLYAQWHRIDDWISDQRRIAQMQCASRPRARERGQR